MSNLDKLNIGCGTDIIPGWVNVDIVEVPGVDVVHDLNLSPWPFKDGSASKIQALDVLEHVNEVIPFIEECYRILEPGGELFMRTPRYDAEFLWIDPTHKRGFHEQSMDFFDTSKPFGQSTGFYSEARFNVSCVILPNKNLEFSMNKI